MPGEEKSTCASGAVSRVQQPEHGQPRLAARRPKSLASAVQGDDTKSYLHSVPIFPTNVARTSGPACRQAQISARCRSGRLTRVSWRGKGHGSNVSILHVGHVGFQPSDHASDVSILHIGMWVERGGGDASRCKNDASDMWRTWAFCRLRAPTWGPDALRVQAQVRVRRS